MGIVERKEREKEQRRRMIVKAAERVFFSKGIETATMDEVARQAELSKGTLYLYFKNKEDLLHAIILKGMKILFNLFQEAVIREELGIKKAEALGQAYLEFFKKYNKYYRLMLHEDKCKVGDDLENFPHVVMCQETGHKIFSLLAGMIQVGIADGSIRPDLDPMKVAFVLWGHSSGIMQVVSHKTHVIETLMGTNQDEIIDYSFKMIKKYLENNHNLRSEEKK